jgi:pre-rRNA-processing protein TSR3
MGKKSKNVKSNTNSRSLRRNGREIRTETDIAMDNGELNESEEDKSIRANRRPGLGVSIKMWEFGQNDPKRDSGSKLQRLGLASRLRVGQTFPGIVLSSEATEVLSPADLDIAQRAGVAGINCSWNRLEEIPFGVMGRSRNQRKLPMLVAANSVNYGKVFKMNTAEALAATLYIVGLKEEAKQLLESFSYGEEFFKLNYEVLEAYSTCPDQDGVRKVEQDYIDMEHSRLHERELRKQKRIAGEQEAQGGVVSCSYMDDMDLPPMQSDSEDEDDGDLEEVESPEDQPLASQEIIVENVTPEVENSGASSVFSQFDIKCSVVHDPSKVT